jgi:hypothetical protein
MRVLAALVLSLVCASPAVAQRFPFSRDLPADANVVVDVNTLNGAVEVVGGAAGRVVVEGAATAKVGFGVPADAVAIAQRVAAQPPIDATPSLVRLGVPVDAEARRAVTVSYRVEVPSSATLTVRTASGAITLRGVAGTATIASGSGAVDLTRVGTAAVTTESSAVRVDGAAALDVRTQSGAIEVDAVPGALAIVTGSGSVRASLRQADVTPAASRVRTRSGAVSLTGVRGALDVETDSARVAVDGAPVGDWQIESGSGEIRVTTARDAAYKLEAESRSGQVHAPDTLTGTRVKSRAEGRIGTPGPTLRLHTRSSSIHVRVAP